MEVICLILGLVSVPLLLWMSFCILSTFNSRFTGYEKGCRTSANGSESIFKELTTSYKKHNNNEMI